MIQLLTNNRRQNKLYAQALELTVRMNMGEKVLWLTMNDESKQRLQKQFPDLAHIIKTHKDMEQSK